MNNKNKTIEEIAKEEGMLSYLWNNTDFLCNLPDKFIKLIEEELGEE